MARERIDIPLVIGGQRDPHRARRAGGDAARPSPRAGRLARARTPEHVAAGDRRRRRGAARLGDAGRWQDRAAVFLRAAELLTTTWRADAQRRDDARPVEDGVPGGDRRRLRADRLLALQPALRAGALRRAAAQQPRDVEPARLPAARGIRLRGHAVQLHVDRRQPADRAGADGQHGDLEAGVERDAERLLHHASCSRRPGCRRASSTSCPATRCRSRTSLLDSPRPRRRALHRQHRACSTACGRRSANASAAIAAIRGWSARRAARTSSSRIRRPTSQALAVAIVRGGFEYQGQKCSAASRVYVPHRSGPRCAIASSR